MLVLEGPVINRYPIDRARVGGDQVIDPVATSRHVHLEQSPPTLDPLKSSEFPRAVHHGGSVLWCVKGHELPALVGQGVEHDHRTGAV